MNIRIRPEISALPAYKAGKPAPIGPSGASWKLSSNENPYAPLPGVLQKVGESLELMNRYPDMANAALTESLSEHLQVAPEQIALGVGSVSVLGHLLGAVCSPGDEVVYAWRSFEAYPISVLSHGATPVQVPLGPGWTHDLEAMRAAVTERTKVVMVCTPNNPTGTVISQAALEAFIDDLPDNVLIMVDEAYAEFVTDDRAANGLALAKKYDNVATLRTFSKAYGLAGMRVGYCVTSPELAAAARTLNPPFSVSAPAQVAAITSLQAKAELLARVAEIVNQRATMIDSLRALGFEVPDSGGNFVWLPAGKRTAEWTDRFAAEGIMVRGYVADDEFDGVRITVGEPEANALAVEVAANLPR
ncbi:histidinol-phosphate transaminase [Naumannella halotolerans]|uniref:Histidinol-phosphate aminotransferase n=1 Tax=Naumannella halotolerans TaxID=993414 RepID=A0A4R7J113_9ACTN|nr:histidinol-phosphate transaminase [Naumannella halotolerans]TDT29973.1 histidinol-phosphate aminotransferase [Naumannella halotolerans]